MRSLADAILLELCYANWLPWQLRMTRSLFSSDREGFLIDMAHRAGIDQRHACTGPLSPHVRDNLQSWTIYAHPWTDIPAIMERNRRKAAS